MIFDLLTAPIADELKLSNTDDMFSSIGRRLSTAARRVSTVASNSVSSVINKLSDTKNRIVFTLKIPRNTMIAHQLASASMVTVASNSLQAIQERRLSMLRAYYTFNKNDDEIDNDSSSDDSGHDTDSGIDHVRKASLVSKSIINPSSSIKNENNIQSFTKASNSIENLSLEIMYQRKLLNSFELEIFDQQWGIDSSGNFKNIEMRGLLRVNQNTRDIILQQLNLVTEEVIKKSEKLKIAEDGHIGLEILHLFTSRRLRQ